MKKRYIFLSSIIFFSNLFANDLLDTKLELLNTVKQTNLELPKSVKCIETATNLNKLILCIGIIKKEKKEVLKKNKKTTEEKQKKEKIKKQEEVEIDFIINQKLTEKEKFELRRKAFLEKRRKRAEAAKKALEQRKLKLKRGN